MINKYGTGTNSAAVATIPALTSPAECVEGLSAIWSYSGTPTNGKLSITTGGNLICEVDITAPGPGFLKLEGLVGLNAQDMVATLAAGGSGVVGKVTLCGKYTQN